MLNQNPGLSVINTETGEIVSTLDEWLHDHRRRQLQLILAQLGGVGAPTGVGDVDAAARLLFAPKEGAA
jgi:hypothetical protein